MDKYTVKFYKRAIKDVESIYEYIAIEKQSPENAKGQADRIKEAILGLDTMPQSHQNRLVGRYAGKGYKQLLIDNYVAKYRIDETQRVVWIVTVQYQGRNR